MRLNLSTPVSDLGYGAVGFNLLKAFDAIGAEPALFPIGAVSAAAFPDHLDLLNRCLKRAESFRHAGPSLRVWHQYPTGGQFPQHGLADSVGRGKRLGLCFAELDRLKSVEVHHLNSLHAVIQPSGWAAGVAEKSGVTVPQTVVPCAVDPEVFWPDELPGGDETIFLAAGKWEYRKGHDVLRQAFFRAFGPEDRVRLVMLCENPFLSPAQRDQWHSYYKHHPLGDKVEIIPQRFQTQRQVARLFRQCHCGVFPARAEGFNLEAAELLAMGRHVILTNYSGHTAYAEAAGAVMIPVGDVEPADDGQWFFSQDPAWEGKPGKWAVLGEAQVNAFASAMRHIHDERLAGRLDVNHAGVDFFRRWTWDAAARRIAEVAIS